MIMITPTGFPAHTYTHAHLHTLKIWHTHTNTHITAGVDLELG